MSDVEFETEFKDSTTKAATSAANATARLAKEVDSLGKTEVQAARASLKLASANDAVARAASRAAKAMDQLHRSGLSDVPAAKASLASAQHQLKLAKARRSLAEAEARAAMSGGRAEGLFAGKGGFAVALGGAAALAGWTKVIGVGVDLIGRGIRESIDFTKATAEMAMFSENTQLAFKNLTGSEAGGKAAFKATRDLSLELGESVSTVSDRMKKLLAQQFSLSEATGLVRMVADLKTIGVHGEKADRVLLALTQIRGKGRLQAEEMLQLAEAGVSQELVYEALGKRLNKTRQELLKLQKAGKVSADDALAAVQEAALKKTGGSKQGAKGAEFASTTLSGALGKLSSSRELFMLDLGEKALSVFKKLAPVIDSITKSLSSPELSGKLGKTFEVLGNLIDNQGPGFGKDFAAGLSIAADAFDRIVKLGTAFTSGFLDGFRPFLNQLSTSGVASIDGLTNSAEIFGVVAGETLGKLITQLNSILEVVNAIGSKFNQVEQFFGGADANARTSGANIGNAFAEGITNSLLMNTGPAGAALTLANQVSGMVEDVWQVHSPSRVAMRIGSQFDAGLAAGMQSGASTSASSRLGAGIAAGFEIPARSGSFQGSPAHRAMVTSDNRRSSASFTQNNTFPGIGSMDAIAEAKTQLFDLAAIARVKVAAGFR